jgi:hypothetical protein
MDDIFKILGAILVGLGGSSVIILGLSSWLGKIWAERIFQKEKHKYDIEFQNYMYNIDKEMQRLKTIDEKALYITKIQYEKEFEIYQNIWKALNECVRVTKNLYPKYEDSPTNEAELEEYNNKKYKAYVEKFNNFSNIISSNAPFYQESFYNNLISLRIKCNQFGDIFKTYVFDVKYSETFRMCRDLKISKEEWNEVYVTLPEEIDEMEYKLQNDIRQYLHKLRVE